MSRVTRKPTTRSAGKTPSITRLYQQFTRAQAKYRAIPDSEEKRWQRAVEKTSQIGRRIVQAQAMSADEMLKKIAVAGWFIGAGETAAQLECWRPKGIAEREEYFALATLRDDVPSPLRLIHRRQGHNDGHAL